MILLDDFLKDLKRVNQFGDEANTSDDTTADLVRWTNRFMKRVANMTAWSWLIKSFSVSIVAGSQDVTLDTTIRKVLAINDGQGGRLKKISLKIAMDWHTPTSTAATTNDLLGYFIDMGVDGTTGAKKIRLYGNPGVSSTLTAYGAKVVPTFSLSDIAAPANFLPFPDEIVDMIGDLVSSRVQKFKGDPNWASYEKVAWDNLRIAMGEEESDPADDVTTNLPAYYRTRRALRMGGRVV